MKTTIISLPIFFTKEFQVIIEKTAISQEYLGKDQENHNLVKITYSNEKQPEIDKIHSDIKLLTQFMNEVSSVFERLLKELFVDITEIIKKLELTQKLDLNEISKN